MYMEDYNKDKDRDKEDENTISVISTVIRMHSTLSVDVASEDIDPVVAENVAIEFAKQVYKEEYHSWHVTKEHLRIVNDKTVFTFMLRLCPKD